MSVSKQYPEAVWCMYCGAGSRMSFMPDPYNFHCPYCNKWNHLDHRLYFEKPFTLDRSSRISFGISQIGGKSRLLKDILPRIPYHEFYLEPFCGSGIVIANKPRCRYECANDLNSSLINYLLCVKYYPEELDEEKQEVMGLVSHEICNRIVRGKLVARNYLEAAYHFYYLNKLTFGGSVQKGLTGILDQKLQNPRIDAPGIEEAKQTYAYLTKGNMGLVNPRAIPQTTLHEKDFKKIKENSPYRGIILPTVCKDKSVKEAKADYQDITPKNTHYKGIGIHGATGWSSNVTEEAEKTKERYKQAQNKGINPKTTRPYSNNDCGLLTPLNPNAIKRLRYVNLTAYSFDKVYKMFYKAFYERKGLEKECFLYIDRPYPGTEKHYKNGFGKEQHKILNKLVLNSPFHVLESLGGKCQWILDEYKDAGLIIDTVYTKYSTNANTQKKRKEYLIMNYDIDNLPRMDFDIEQQLIERWSKCKT